MKPTSLLQAIEQGDLARVRDLIAEGAKLAVTDAEGCFTALGAAAYRGDTEIVRALLEAGVPVDEDYATACPLAAAALGGRADTARVLVEAGATIDLPDETGMTPLMHAARTGRLETVRYLVEAGAELNRRECDSNFVARQSALSYAVHEGFPEVAEYLLQRGARFDPEDFLEESGAMPNDSGELILLARQNHVLKLSDDC